MVKFGFWFHMGSCLFYNELLLILVLGNLYLTSGWGWTRRWFYCQVRVEVLYEESKKTKGKRKYRKKMNRFATKRVKKYSKFIYTWTMIMDICIVTIARLYTCASIHPLKWATFGPKCVYFTTFSILDSLVWML